MGILGRRAAAAHAERVVEAVLTDVERESMAALWQLKAPPCEEFDATYREML